VTDTLSPGLLIATPTLDCPFFGKSLVLLVEHGDSGSFGFVINREAGVEMRDIMGELKIDLKGDGDTATPVMVGGPVTPETGWIIFDPREMVCEVTDSTDIIEGLAVSASVEVLERIAEGVGPKKSLMFLGYAGWGPGQLDGEIMEGSWLPMDFDHQLVFETPPAERWDAAYLALGVDPALVGRHNIADA